MLDLKGITPATVLPLTPDAQIDEPELRKYIRWIAGQGIKAVAVNVDTGEGPHLWHDEKLRVLRIYREELAGRGIPIVAGLGASFTAQAVKYAKEYREAGAEAFLVFPITAYLGQPLDPEVPYRYHRAIADEVGLTMPQLAIAWVLQNPNVAAALVGASRPEQIASNVAASGVTLDADTMAAIADAVGGVAVTDAEETYKVSPKSRP